MTPTNVTKLVPFKALDYPTLPNSDSAFFTRQFRHIENAIMSIENMMKAAMFGVTTKAGLPATADLPSGTSGIFKDTSGGGVYLAYNDGGTIKKVALT
jgi:hypothetical protein